MRVGRGGAFAIAPGHEVIIRMCCVGGEAAFLCRGRGRFLFLSPKYLLRARLRASITVGARGPLWRPLRTAASWLAPTIPYSYIPNRAQETLPLASKPLTCEPPSARGVIWELSTPSFGSLVTWAALVALY